MRSLLLLDEFFVSLKKAIDRFMLVLSTLHKIDAESFSVEATFMKAVSGVYFADNEETLLANGNTTKPKAIPQSPFGLLLITIQAVKDRWLSSL